jgi:hypothetical protein
MEVLDNLLILLLKYFHNEHKLTLLSCEFCYLLARGVLQVGMSVTLPKVSMLLMMPPFEVHKQGNMFLKSPCLCQGISREFDRLSGWISLRDGLTNNS